MIWMSVCLVLAIIITLMFSFKHQSMDKNPSAASSNTAIQESDSLSATQAAANAASEALDPGVKHALSFAQQCRHVSIESLRAAHGFIREQKEGRFATLETEDAESGAKTTVEFEDEAPIKVRVKTSNGPEYYALISTDGIVNQYLEYGSDGLVSLAIEFYYPSGKPSWVRHLTNGMYFGVTEHYNEQGALIDSTNYTTPTPVVLHFWPHGVTNLEQKSP
jgi:hypothetical protein